MLSKPQGKAAEPIRKSQDSTPQVTVKGIMEVVGGTDICTEDIRLGMPTAKDSDYVGDLRRANTVSLSFGNVNKGLFRTKDVRPKKGNEQLWSAKHRSVCLLQKLTETDIMMCQEGGLTPRKNVVERIARLHGYGSIVDARSRQEEKAKGSGAGEGMLMQWKEWVAGSITQTFHYRNSIQAIVLLGEKKEGAKQNGLMVINIYLPSGYTDEACKKRDDLVKHIAWMVQENERLGYETLVCGDFNCALRDEDRSGERSTEEKIVADQIRALGLVDIWQVREREAKWKHGAKAHTWIGSGDRSGSSRIDMALCSEGILEYIEGIRVDSVKRIEGMDHRWVSVDINNSWWGKVTETPLTGSDWDGQRGRRISTNGWTPEEWKKYRQIATDLMDPKNGEIMPKVERYEQIVFTTGQPRRVESANTGTRWEYSSKNVRNAWKWNEANRRKGQERTIRAIKVHRTVEEGGEALDLSGLRANKEWRMGKVATRYNIDNEIVLLKEGTQEVAAEITVEQSPQETQRLQAWANRIKEGSVLRRFEGTQGQLNYRLEQLIEVVRVAAAKASGEQEREVYTGGVNSRPLWSPVLKAVERERALIRNMKWAMEKYFEKDEECYLQLARDRSAEWVVEWRCARGELSEEIERDRKRVQLPTVSEEAKGRWRRMEKPTDVTELIFIEEVTESLEVPQELTAQNLGRWRSRIEERYHMLKTVSRVSDRKILFEELANREAQQERYNKGKVKGLINKILHDGREVHKIDKVVLQDGGEKRLSSEPGEVRKETERHVFEWMKKKAEPWGTPEERKRGEFPVLNELERVKQRACEENPVLPEVGRKIQRVLKRAHQDTERGRKLRNIHKGTDRPIEKDELEDYFGKVKKGTAPGVSGVGVELWAWGAEAVKEELLDILNKCLAEGVIPGLWAKRLIRPLAKTDTAIGLSDIRPITLLDVTQKILTGILTERLSKVWNENEVLHWAQMAFLQGKGCYQALERVRGILLDCKAQNKAGTIKDAHILFLDLAKAYDSVEYWALEDAMRGLGVPEGILTLMRQLDEAARAKVLTGGTAKETDWIELQRGAPQGEVMSPLRFIAWMNILLEVVYDGEGEGYETEEMAQEQEQECAPRYAGQAFCDDGMFIAENNAELQILCDKVSAFCELYQVKINAGKSYYTVDRGVERNKRTREAWRPGQIRLWDHTANEGAGAWQTVIETRPNEAIRYLGVMVAADGSSEAQTEKVNREVHKRLEQIRQSRCPPGMANYMVTAVVGGLLNYHAPFTRISKTMRRRWDRHILSVLREKTYVRRDTIVGALYNREGKGLSWFSAKSCIAEAIVTEGLITLTSDTVEGRMLRQQVARLNLERGTVYSPYRHPVRHNEEFGKMQSGIIMLENALSDLGWTIDTDKPAHGSHGHRPDGYQEIDVPLELIEPAMTQQRIAKQSMVLDAHRCGWHWLSQLVTAEGGYKDAEGLGTYEVAVLERWKKVLGDGRVPNSEWVEVLRSSAEEWTDATRTVGGVRPVGTTRAREYELATRTGQFGDYLQADGAELIAVSDGSLRGGSAAFAMLPVQNLSKVCASRIVGVQGIAKAELIGAWAQLKSAEPKLRTDSEAHFVGFLDNEGMVKTLRQAHMMSHRDLHRARQGNLYLREIKALMREFGGRVQWEWLKAHTDRKGWFYERHNKCDYVAGVVTEDEDRPQARFVEWDWDYILVDDLGKRVEGDVRRAVRQRISEQAWEKGRDGGSARRWAQMLPAQDRVVKAIFRDRAQLPAQREIMAAMGERWGLRSEYGDEKGCRLCADRCPCGDRRLNGKGKQREGAGCARCDETYSHLLQGECNTAMRLLKEELVQKATKGIVRTLKPWELEQVYWTAEGDVVEASEGAVGQEVSTVVKPGTEDKWVHSYWNGTRWEPWQGSPFMREGRVDLLLLLRANEKSQYPRQTSSTSSKTTLYRGEDQRRWDGSVEQEAWRGEINMGPMYVKMLRVVRQSGAAGEELWSQLDMVDQIMHHVSRRSGPVWEGLVEQLRRAQKGVPLSLGPESVWAWTPQAPMLDPHLSWMNVMQRGELRTDITMRMLWGKVGERQTVEMKSRMEERGPDLWDWYIVPAGALDSAFGRTTRWVGGVGARKMCTLPAAPLGKEQTEGELWFVGGEQAFGTIDWEPLDEGEGFAQRTIQEWMGLGSEHAHGWHTGGMGFAWARGGATDGLEKRCTAAAIVDSGEKAAKLSRVGMELVWGLKRVYKREIWNKRGNTEEEEGGNPETPAVMVVRGKDATRGSYQMPTNTWVRKKGLVVGRKLREGQKWRALKVSNLDELVFGEAREHKKPSRKSKWIPKKADQWLRLIDLAASRRRKGPPVPGEEGEECQLCGREAAATQEGVRLCRRCNNSAPGAALGRELEGYMLASWCLALLGGEAWMRAIMLDKGRWRRWQRALRNEERSVGAEQWWWKLLTAIIPEEEREVIQTVRGSALTADEWKAWWGSELRETQGLSLLHEFYEEQPSGHRSAWHRQQLRVIYRMWGLQTPLEATLSGKGEEALDEWEARGREGSSNWSKHRGAVVSEERWPNCSATCGINRRRA